MFVHPCSSPSYWVRGVVDFLATFPDLLLGRPDVGLSLVGRRIPQVLSVVILVNPSLVVTAPVRYDQYLYNAAYLVT